MMIDRFDVISSIDLAYRNSWEDKIFLTFDIDWAHDDVINETIDLVEHAGVAATWFLTHDTPVKERIRANPKFELGIHPNFNFLLDGDFRNGRNSREVIGRIMDVVPEAKVIRSHSIAQSSVLVERFKEAGLTHESNHLIPHYSGITLEPYLLYEGICSVPYHFEDDVCFVRNCMDSMVEVLARPGLQVYDFPPIHVFLNTDSIDRYERTRQIHHNPKELVKYRHEGYGTRNRLLELLNLV